MGEVYRARDTKLKREVAIKILPDEFSRDPDRVSRFQREAEVLASLNHPNIAAIHSFEEANGARFLVLELVAGETLAERIKRGPIPVDGALTIAKQICEALEAAHEKGIVHRDLKPANVKITPDGVVKVLDFGLAKVVASDASGSGSHAVAHLESSGTADGVILGTAAYMSPEQARGRPVDKRTDIWAFGCVLYEMLTGRRAFLGETLTDTLGAVLDREPDWTALPIKTPARVREVLRRCLAKNIADRTRDIGDITLDLDAALAGDVSAQVGEARATGVGWKVATLVALLVAASTVALLWQREEPPISGDVAPLPTIGSLTRLTSDSGLTTQPSLTADGRLVAYASNRGGDGNLDIYVQQTTGGTAIRLTDDPADDHEPSLSPDGSLVAFRSERTPRGIYVASALGGGVRLLAPDGKEPAFSPDGRSIAFWTGRWLAPRGKDAHRQAFVMPASGGASTRVATNLASAGDLVWAPDGRSLLLFGWKFDAGEMAEPHWWWLPVGSGTAVRTGAFARLQAQGVKSPVDVNLPYPLTWSDGGVIFSGDRGSDTSDAQGLWVVAVDPASGRLTSDAVRLTNGTTRDLAASVAQNGRMVFSAQTSFRATLALTLDANAGKATGTFRRVRDDTVETGRTSVSEDGRLMVLPKYETDAGSLWVRNLQTGREWQLAATPRTPLNPVMSADGRWVAYTVTKVVTGGDAGFGDVFIVPTDGGVPRKVCESCEAQGWTRDNQQIVVTDQDRKTLIRVDVTSGDRIPLVATTSSGLDRPLFGPNGRWVTFNSNGGTFVATVRSDRATAEAEWTMLIETTGGERSAGLSPDGRLLYLLLERDGFRCLYAMRLDPATGRSNGEPFPVAHVHEATRRWGSTGYGSAVARGIFIANLFETTGNLWMTTLATKR